MSNRFNKRPPSKAVLPFKWQEHFTGFLKLLPPFVVMVVDPDYHHADPQYFGHLKITDLIKPTRLTIIPKAVKDAGPLVLSVLSKEMENLASCFENMAKDCRQSLLEIVRVQEKPLSGLGGGDNGGASSKEEQPGSVK